MRVILQKWAPVYGPAAEWSTLSAEPPASAGPVPNILQSGSSGPLPIVLGVSCNLLRVIFLDEHELFDLGEFDLLQWRHAGSNWVSVPSWEDENPGIKDGVAIISMKKVLKKGERINKLTGTTIREDLAHSMQDMPMEAQRIFADRVSTGLGVLREELRNMISRNDRNVIQMEDMKRMLEKFKERTGAQL